MAQKFTTGITVRDLASAASDAVAVSVAGDTNDRIKFEAGGKVVWGSGASAGDVNLYRDAADRLKTDDALQADGGLITVTTAGTPTLSLPDGALAIDTVNNLLYIRTNSAWEIASGGGASVTTSDGAPVDPEDGDLWYETDTGSMFVYYDDGASQQWVEVGTAGVIAMTTSDTAPSTPSGGDLWFDTSTAKTYVYYAEETSSQWVEIGAASAASHGEDGYIQFATGGSFNSASALVWDDTNKRLGIGTTTPNNKLQVAGNVYLGNFQNVTPDASGTGHLMIGGSGYTGFATLDGSAMWVGHNSSARSLNLATNETARVTVTGAGDVGIGTTSPAYLLDVNGSSALRASVVLFDGTNSAGSIGTTQQTGSANQVLISSSRGLGGIRFDVNSGTALNMAYNRNVYPGSDDAQNFGNSSARWDNIYATNTSIVSTSDERDKANITDIDLGLGFINDLRPVTYTRNDRSGYVGTRIHMGFVAQEVAMALGDKSSNRGIWIDGSLETETDPETGEVISQGYDRQGLRYGDFIAPLVKSVQELSSMVQTLTERIEALEAN